MVAPTASRLEPHARGSLHIWVMPEPGRQYVIGSDTAGGGSRGDSAAAVVLDAETCDLVAGFAEKADPHVWGPRCAHLGWFYNTAVLGFETEPSRHGLAAAVKAQEMGYERLYYRRRQDSWRRNWTDILGFSTDVAFKPLLISRMKQQIAQCEELCAWEALLDELWAQKWDDNERMVSKGHDDLVLAWGIALMVRDDCYDRGIIEVEKKTRLSESERMWEHEDRLAAARLRARPRIKPVWRR